MSTTNASQTDVTESHFRTCSLCEAMCGVEIKTKDDQIISIKGDKSDPFSRGAICPKATALQDLHNDPDRIRRPIQRTPDGWKEISWEEALDTVADNIKSTQEKYGNNAVGMYIGNPTVHNHGALLLLPLLFSSLKTRNRFSATSVDQLPHMLAALKMFGSQLLLPVPDIDHTQTFICIGANPMASNGSLMSIPDVTTRLKAIQKRGGKIIVVDPRRTETAELADQHISINPASDPFLLLALLNVIFKEGKETLGSLNEFVDGIEVIKDISLRFTPEKVCDIIGITADEIKNLACDIYESESATIYGRFGVCTQEYGGINAWLLYVLNIVTGNLDTRGGMMFTRPAIDIPGMAPLSGQRGSFDRWKSRVSSYPEFAGEFPVAAMAEEMLTEGKGQIKAMLIHAGNPVLSTPDGKQLEKALSNLDFMVSIDFYINETNQYANIILPPPGPLEHPHYDIAFHMLAIRNTTKYSKALFEIEDGAKHDWEIFLELITRLDSEGLKGKIKSKIRQKVMQRMGADGILDLLLRLGPYGPKIPTLEKVNDFFEDSPLLGKPYSKVRDMTLNILHDSSTFNELIRVSPYREGTNPIGSGLTLEKLKNSPHGIDIGPLKPCLPERLGHREKRIQLAPTIFVNDIKRLNAKLFSSDIAKDKTKDLLLIGRRQMRSNNSWMHNSLRLVKGKPRCTVIIHPADAKARKVKEGSTVIVESRVGKIEIAVEISDKIKQGVISIPHGWGHNRPGTRQAIAEKHAGVSFNDISDAKLVDPLSGASVLCGVPVSLKVVAIKKSTTKKKKKTAKKAKP